MNIRKVIEELEWFVQWLDDPYTPVEMLGQAAWVLGEDIAYALQYLKAVVPVETAHDAAGEMESWENFFEEMKERADG